jgi:hypothetical protein
MESVEARPDWLSLAEAAELENLMLRFGNFHDGCVREIHIATGHYVDQDLSMTVDWRTNVRMLVQRQYRDPSAIELRFDSVISMHLSPPPPNCESIIIDAAFFVRDGIYYWADNSLWKPERACDGNTTWIAARHVYWRDASDWLGPRPRYLALSD